MNEFMSVANDLACSNLIDNSGGPFGAVVVKDGKIIGYGKNQVLLNHDPSAHAEIMAIRDACSKMGTHDLSGCSIYTSCYPCPMCLSAIIWSNIKDVYYGNTKEDADEIGFRDKFIYEYLEGKNKDLISLKEMDRDYTIKCFLEYKDMKDKTLY